jgi:fumarate hydratase subunit beta
MKRLKLPLTRADIEGLNIGDEVALSGVIYTARDAAHQRMADAIKNGQSLPFDIKDAVVYYAGPTPAKPGQIIGSCGPTTSCRMDAFAPLLYDLGMRGVIGKGPVGEAVKQAIQRNNGCYFAATGGAGALIADSIKSVEVIAYEELGTESIKRMEIKDLPAFVAVVRDQDIYQLD